MNCNKTDDVKFIIIKLIVVYGEAEVENVGHVIKLKTRFVRYIVQRGRDRVLMDVFMKTIAGLY